MPKSKAEIMKVLREKRKALGLNEVRGIWLPDNLHDKLKKIADKLKLET
jgi:hypothetical protein